MLKDQNDPSIADCHYNMGIVFKNLKKIDEAFEHLDSSMRLRSAHFGEKSVQCAQVQEVLGKIRSEREEYG